MSGSRPTPRVTVRASWQLQHGHVESRSRASSTTASQPLVRQIRFCVSPAHPSSARREDCKVIVRQPRVCSLFRGRHAALEPLVHVDEYQGVERGVLKLRGRQRPSRPVGHAHALVKWRAKDELRQLRQPDRTRLPASIDEPELE
eukprot:6214681-Pleurochrysis_carterae.AAC.6